VFYGGPATKEKGRTRRPWMAVDLVT